MRLKLTLNRAGGEPSGDILVTVDTSVTVAWYLLLASLAMGVADLLGFWRPRGGSIRGTIGSSIPPLVVLVAAYFF